MGKNFASIYSSGNDSSALNQTFFLKKEVTRGTPVAATSSDFLYTMSGGSINFTQPYELSPHKTGRHANNIIKQKTSTEWSLSTLFNISPAALYGACIDTPVKALWEAVLGKQTDTGTGLKYDSSVDPSVTFTLFENLDHMAKQAPGSFVNQVEVQLPGDGMAQSNWSGNSKTVYHAGIGKSTIDNTANTVTLQAGEGKRFDVGALVMIVESDGVTRSADTPTPRTVTAVAGDVVTLSGAVLADADGSTTPIYLCYWEPTTYTGIDEPATGLVGSVSIDTLPTLSCVRSATLTLNNNHELADYCYGTDGLSGPLFIPAARLEAKLSIEMNLNAPMVEFMKRIRNFEAHDVQLILGAVADRHLQIDCPKVKFSVPAISVPESGSVPVSFEGDCLQTALEAADEVSVLFT